MEDFKARGGIELSHVPYQGFPQVRAGKLSALGVASLGRVAALGGLPTPVEQGFAGFEAQSWLALLAPAKTAPENIRRLSAHLMRILRSDEFRASQLTQYFSAGASTPEGLQQLMAADRKKWALVIKAAGVQAD